MTPPISMIVAAILGLALGYSGRRWWLSGIVTGSLLTLYGMSGRPEGIIMVAVIHVKVEKGEATITDIIGETKILKDVEIVEVNVPATRLVLKSC